MIGLIIGSEGNIVTAEFLAILASLVGANIWIAKLLVQRVDKTAESRDKNISVLIETLQKSVDAATHTSQAIVRHLDGFTESHEEIKHKLELLADKVDDTHRRIAKQ